MLDRRACERTQPEASDARQYRTNGNWFKCCSTDVPAAAHNLKQAIPDITAQTHLDPIGRNPKKMNPKIGTPSIPGSFRT
ncbi:MAG TPA: hypothetical protein VIU12_16210 [Chryseolinea sp.]